MARAGKREGPIVLKLEVDYATQTILNTKSKCLDEIYLQIIKLINENTWFYSLITKALNGSSHRLKDIRVEKIGL